MALEETARQLMETVRTLRERTAELSTTICEGRPLAGDVVLVDMYGDAAEGLRGWLEEAWRASLEIQAAVKDPADLSRARRALAACRAAFKRMERHFHQEMVSYERLAELVGLGRSRGGEWQAWVGSVRRALDECRPPLAALDDGLFRCYEEVAERAAMAGVSVQATNIGQQITVQEGREALLEPVT